MCALAINHVSAADSYPQRPVRLIIPAPAGGGADVLGRLFTPKLSESMGQQFIIDNRPGGGQVIATELTARAEPDGYTLLLAAANHAINRALVKKLPYDSVKDFSNIMVLVDSPLICVANPALGVSNIQELITAAKARPGRISYGSAGNGSGGHLAVELIKYMAGIDLLHIPYKGASLALADLMGAHIQLMCTSPLTALPQVKTGRLRALAMTSAKRTAIMPDVPTVAESGLKGYQATLWYLLLAPAKTAEVITKRLHAEFVRILRMPDVIDQLAAQGVEPVGNSSQEAARFLQSEIDRWTNLINQTKITAN
jgi:tripartite-type tricarboxylate transporter receptor subunit TctC